MLRFLAPIGLSLLVAGTLEPCEPPDEPTPTPEPVECIVTGCSGQICASEQVATTCEWTCTYGCYQYATCEVQPDGVCGWTPTEAYDTCVTDCDDWMN